MEIYLSDEQDVPLPIESVRWLARSVLDEEGLPTGTEVGIIFVTDEEMADHNARFLSKNGPTDVLALPLNPPDGPVPSPSLNGSNPPYSIGDVLIAPRFVNRQARESGAESDHEILLMVVHGLLHLLGYDHTTGPEAELMEGRERALLATFGVERR